VAAREGRFNAGRVHRWRSVKTPRREFQHGYDLFPRNVKLVDDFLYGGSGFNVFEHGGYRHPGIAKYPCAAQPPRHAFHDGTL
jgi:hypothetical protein